ncbi:MAG: flagellar filament outer layer protein FlaA [Treponemataceae bacterium]|nr:flagellar filament outer layer protein FlaA [Treponemataceae bacterium]
MKKGIAVVVGLAFATAFGFAQSNSRAVETVVVDDFDNEGAQDYHVPGKGFQAGEKFNWTWNVQASAFIDDENGFPKLEYFDGQPNSLRLLNGASDNTPKVLGVEVSFKRKGENWFEIYPEVDGKPFEIPLKGTVTQIDFWVWGANYLYFLDLLVRDSDGRVYTLPTGNLAFNGWKNIIVSIPSYLKQRSRLRTGPRTMSFVGFRVRTDPNEYVDNFDIFIDQLKYTTNTLSNVFDGYELQGVEFAGSDGGSANSSSNVSQDGK